MNKFLSKIVSIMVEDPAVVMSTSSISSVKNTPSICNGYKKGVLGGVVHIGRLAIEGVLVIWSCR